VVPGTNLAVPMKSDGRLSLYNIEELKDDGSQRRRFSVQRSLMRSVA
jgi:hypothetical protein